MSARMSSADTAWLHMDRPTNLMVINSVDLFDQPLDWDRVKEITQTRLIDRYPRFRQRVVESRLPWQAPRWEDDPDFSLEHHMHHLALPAPGDRAASQVERFRPRAVRRSATASPVRARSRPRCSGACGG